MTKGSTGATVLLCTGASFQKIGYMDVVIIYANTVGSHRLIAGIKVISSSVMIIHR